MARFPMPLWFSQLQTPLTLHSHEERMRFAIMLSERNVAHGSGGPFGAALFNLDTGELIEAAVNRVVPDSCSAAHAEICAFVNAQDRIGNFTLAAIGNVGLYSSCEPCAMCSGAIPWAGITLLAYGALREDAELVGFDEGDKPDLWDEKLSNRGITVIGGLCRSEAAAVFHLYASEGGVIYNGLQ